jgi:hypothetical protein
MSICLHCGSILDIIDNLIGWWFAVADLMFRRDTACTEFVVGIIAKQVHIVTASGFALSGSKALPVGEAMKLLSCVPGDHRRPLRPGFREDVRVLS